MKIILSIVILLMFSRVLPQKITLETKDNITMVNVYKNKLYLLNSQGNVIKKDFNEISDGNYI